MKKRDLSIFVHKKEFVDFTNKFNLKMFIKDGSICLMNEYIYAYIYTYMPFDYVPTFLIYNRKENLYSEANFLIFLREKDALSMYNEYDKVNNISNIDNINPNDINIERQFIVTINILGTFFSELFEGDFSRYNSVFKPMRDFDKNIVNEIFK